MVISIVEESGDLSKIRFQEHYSVFYFINYQKKYQWQYIVIKCMNISYLGLWVSISPFRRLNYRGNLSPYDCWDWNCSSWFLLSYLVFFSFLNRRSRVQHCCLWGRGFSISSFCLIEVGIPRFAHPLSRRFWFFYKIGSSYVLTGREQHYRWPDCTSFPIRQFFSVTSILGVVQTFSNTSDHFPSNFYSSSPYL